MVEERISQDPEGQSNKNIILSSYIEKVSVLSACFDNLVVLTSIEVEGQLLKGGQEKVKTLRNMVVKLTTNLGMEDKLSPAEWLIAGVLDFIPDEKLQELTNQSGKVLSSETEINLIAKYFLEKRQRMKTSEPT